MSGDDCPHRGPFMEAYIEGVMLPLGVGLEHFDQCMSPEGRLKAWTHLQELGERAGLCIRANHEGLLDELQWSHDRIAELSGELAGRLRGRAARIAYRARRTRSKR